MSAGLRFVQHFHAGPLCEWPECSKRSCAFYSRENGSAIALCAGHVRELAEAGQIDLNQDAFYDPRLPVFAKEKAS